MQICNIPVACTIVRQLNALCKSLWLHVHSYRILTVDVLSAGLMVYLLLVACIMCDRTHGEINI